MEIVLSRTQTSLNDLWPLLVVCWTNIDFGSNFSVNDISFHGNLVSELKLKTCSWFSDQLLWKAHKEEFKVGQRSTKSSRSTCSGVWKPDFRWGDITLLLMLIYANWTLVNWNKLSNRIIITFKWQKHRLSVNWTSFNSWETWFWVPDSRSCQSQSETPVSWTGFRS